jgi:PAS domain-containing protein
VGHVDGSVHGHRGIAPALKRQKMHDEIQQMILIGLKMIKTVNTNTNTEHTMHTSMTELFENLKHGLIWVGSDGIVRYANRSGARHTGLSNGRRIADPDLVWAVVTTAVAQVERHLTLNRAPAHAGGSTVPLACRVVPGR